MLPPSVLTVEPPHADGLPCAGRLPSEAGPPPGEHLACRSQSPAPHPCCRWHRRLAGLKRPFLRCKDEEGDSGEGRLTSPKSCDSLVVRSRPKSSLYDPGGLSLPFHLCLPSSLLVWARLGGQHIGQRSPACTCAGLVCSQQSV